MTYTVTASDSDGSVGWDLSVDGASIGSGGQGTQSFTQTYDAPGNHTAVLTASDGIDTVQRQLTVEITAGSP